MKRYIQAKSLAVLLLSLFSWSCGDSSPNVAGTEIGNPNTVALSIVGVDEPTLARTIVRAQSGNLTLDRVLIAISDIEFVPQVGGSCEVEAEDRELAFEGPFYINLLSDTSKPDLGIVEIPAGEYCEIEFDIDVLENDERPDGVSSDNPLVGHSIYVKGTLENGTVFIIESDLSEEFEVEALTSVLESSDKGLRSYLIAFFLNTWFSGMNFDSATLSAGKILINESSNDVLLDVFESNIDTSAELFEDDDKDGELDEDEEDD